MSPSSSKQWTACTASIAYVEANRHRVPPENTRYADEGTEAHEWAAKILLGQTHEGDIPDNFKPHVPNYVSRCLTHAQRLGTAPMVETVVPLWYQNDQTGTCDFAVVTDDEVVIRDLKYGAGVLVKADDNTQAAIYAHSFMEFLGGLYSFHPATKVVIEIDQPRHREADSAKPWVLSYAELQEFCKDIDRAVLDIQTGNTVFSPSDGDDGSCRWCKAKTFCPSRAAAAFTPLDDAAQQLAGMNALDLLMALPDLTKAEEKKADDPVGARLAKLDPEAPIRLTDEILVKLFERTKAITSFLGDIADGLSQRAIAGEPIPGLKLVMGREGNREWANEEAADTFLKGQGLKEDQRYNFKLKSPTQAEELIAEKLEKSKRTATRFSELVTRSAAKPVMAHESDKRPAINAVCAQLPDLDAIEEFEV
jgi:hypothetical protein